MNTLPCSRCGESIPAEATVCPECHKDPAAMEILCTRCGGEGDLQASYYTYGVNTLRCPGRCRDGLVEAPYAYERSLALAGTPDSATSREETTGHHADAEIQECSEARASLSGARLGVDAPAESGLFQETR